MTQNLPGTQNVPIVIGAGALIRINKHHGNDYRVLSVPKSAIPQALWQAKEVIMLVVVPNNNIPLTLEARRWTEKRNYIYYTVRKPYTDYFRRLVEQGIREIVLLQVIPKGGGRA